MAHFDPTALCFLNPGDEPIKNEGNKVIDRDDDTYLYYTADWKVKGN